MSKGEDEGFQYLDYQIVCYSCLSRMLFNIFYQAKHFVDEYVVDKNPQHATQISRKYPKKLRLKKRNASTL